MKEKLYLKEGMHMINNVTLVGRLTRDADLRYTASGVAVATFNLAVNRNYSNQNGERETDFINCVIWRKPAENLANYTRKGSLIGLTGRLQTRNYENQQGQRVYVTEVIVENFQMLESREVTENRKQAANQTNQASNPTNTTSQPTQPFMDYSSFGGQSVEISEDDLPF